MNERQARFVQEYVIDWNATQAAIRAGYSKRSAGTTGGRLLENDEIAAAIEAEKQAISERAAVTVDELVAELDAVAMARIVDAFEEGPGGAPRLKKWSDLPDGVRAAISAVDISDCEYDDDGALLGCEVKIRGADKIKALIASLKYRGELQDDGRLILHDEDRALLAAYTKQAGE